MPVTGARVGRNPQPRRLLGGAVTALDRKAEILQQIRDVVADAPALVLGADQHDQPHRRVVVGPAPGRKARAERLHLAIDRRTCGLRIVRIAQLELARDAGEPCVIGKRRRQRQKARHREAAEDLLGDVAAVHQAIERLADRRHVERVQLAIGELGAGRIERQLARRAEREVVGRGERVAHPVEHRRARDALREHLMRARLDQPGDASDVGLAREDDLIDQRSAPALQVRGADFRAGHRRLARELGRRRAQRDHE
ncbi:MAG TPA: hypothetical protein PL143_01090 [Rhodocyclaceae bacterium]|nr:hypothetical protein [Rhodocyclaceae bacterium]